MSPTCRSNVRRRGFTVLEAIVSLAILIIVMVTAMSLLFGMRGFAERQQFFMVPRQTARRASDYIAGYIQGASDLNNMTAPPGQEPRPNPNAIVTWFRSQDCGDMDVRATYNNLTGSDAPSGINASGGASNFGDVGTDILSFSVPVAPLRIPVGRWPGFQHAANWYLDYRLGCPDDAANLDMFARDTNANPYPLTNQSMSPVLGMYDANGVFVYVQITSYQRSRCDNAPDVIHVVANPGRSEGINPPSGHPALACTFGRRTGGCFLSAGQRFLSFRIRNGNLEQKDGLFNPCGPDADSPGTAFVPIIENVEDMQVAWMYGQDPGGGSLFYGTAGHAIQDPLANPDPGGTASLRNYGTPPQAGQVKTTDGTNPSAACDQSPIPAACYITPTLYDITRVRGVRISFTARSTQLPLNARQQREGSNKTGTQRVAGNDVIIRDYSPEFNYRPASEDHTYTTAAFTLLKPDLFEHYKMTSMLMIRNRMLGY